MDLFSQSVEQSELVKGDHIYSWRKIIYSHHGIFIGERTVIHFVNPQDGGSVRFSAPSSSSISGGGGGRSQKINCRVSNCGLEKVAGSGVRLSCIDCFIKTGSLYRFKYNASREFLLAKLRGGTCTTATSDPSEEVIRRATYLYENGYKEYDLMNNNCEDFALYCKTGLWSADKQHQGRSSQANMVRRSAPSNEEGAIGKFLHRVSTAIPRSFSKREYKDLGIRDDVVKVSVEHLSSFLRTLQ